MSTDPPHRPGASGLVRARLGRRAAMMPTVLTLAVLVAAWLASVCVPARATGARDPIALRLDGLTPVAAAVAEPVPSPAGLVAFVPPLPPPLRVTRPFAPPPSPYAAGHRGVDVATGLGSPVQAAGAGTVLYAGLLAGRPVISIRHADGLRTTYEPVRPSVTAGQMVTVGQPIGTLLGGHLGCPVAACLHWGLIGPDGYRDPLTLLTAAGPVRLLPLAPGAAGDAVRQPAVAAATAAPAVAAARPSKRLATSTPRGPGRASPPTVLAGRGTTLGGPLLDGPLLGGPGLEGTLLGGAGIGLAGAAALSIRRRSQRR